MPPSFSVIPCDTCQVVPVRLRTFSVERIGDGARLYWVVAEAEDHAGFHVHREQAGEPRVRLTETLLANREEYEFIDTEAPSASVKYWLEEVSRAGISQWYGPVSLAPKLEPPVALWVGRSIPNPFQSQMRLAYTLPETRPVRISIYDLHGRLVRVLTDESQGPGGYTVEWRGEMDTGTAVVPGMYLIKFRAGTEVRSRKVLYIR